MKRCPKRDTGEGGTGVPEEGRKEEKKCEEKGSRPIPDPCYHLAMKAMKISKSTIIPEILNNS